MFAAIFVLFEKIKKIKKTFHTKSKAMKRIAAFAIFCSPFPLHTFQLSPNNCLCMSFLYLWNDLEAILTCCRGNAENENANGQKLHTSTLRSVLATVRCMRVYVCAIVRVCIGMQAKVKAIGSRLCVSVARCL